MEIDDDLLDEEWNDTKERLWQEYQEMMQDREYYKALPL